MALLWSKLQDGKLLEVRAAGHTRRLYVDGVLHTQYNPELPLTGGVWDYLALSALFAPSGAIKRVLVLGLGGGAAVQLLRRYVSPKRIVAVELDQQRIQLARRFFDVTAAEVKLVGQDAREWVRGYRGKPFHLIIDDLFGEEEGEPVRAVAFDDEWSGALLRVLARPGWLAVNFAPPAALEHAALLRGDRYRQRFPSAFRLTDDRTDNAVGVFCGLSTTTRAMRRAIDDCPGLQSNRARRMLRFHAATLW